MSSSGMSAVHIMLDALQRLGAHPMDGYIRTLHTTTPETLIYTDDRPGTYIGFTEECTYRRGDRCRQGRMTYTNGDVYDGEWDRDHFHGHGSFEKANEEHTGFIWQFVGEFDQDKPVSGKLLYWSNGVEQQIQSDMWVKASIFSQKPAVAEAGTIRPLDVTYFPG